MSKEEIGEDLFLCWEVIVMEIYCATQVIVLPKAGLLIPHQVYHYIPFSADTLFKLGSFSRSRLISDLSLLLCISSQYLFVRRVPFGDL